MLADGSLVPVAVTRYEIAAQLLGAVHPPPDETSTMINDAMAEAGVVQAVGFAKLQLVTGTRLSLTELQQHADMGSVT
ncbi:hypothetical protein [Nannocystis pusilla]|uniref:hypothetical protein n=1 Tax=Nannocystis pusilla TaxID=889268 RepID=UPI003B79B9E2